MPPSRKANHGGRSQGNILLCLLVLGIWLPCHAQEPIQVAATLPYLGRICEAVGGNLVSVHVLSRPGEDPHGIKVTPSMTAKVKASRLFIENGMQLESWSRRLIDASGNRFLLPGQGGHVYATNGILALEKPSAAILASGAHVHAAGNPHVWLDPVNLKVIARNIEKGLARSLYQSASVLAKNRAAFEKKVDEAFFGRELVHLLGGRSLENRHRTGTLLPFLRSRSFRGRRLVSFAGGYLGRALKLKNKKIISYHRTWSYLEKAFDLEVVATLESKPGIPPSPSHLEKLRKLVASRGAGLVVTPPYYPKSRIEGFAKQIGLPLVVLPTQPGEAGAPDDVLLLYDHILKKLEGALR